MHSIRSNGAQTLLIDADDTLWENNIYFERAIAKFISYLDHKEHSREQVREILNEVERGNILTHGYGLHSFAHALITTFEKLSVDPVTPEMHATIHSFCHEIAEHPVEVIDGVAETLEYLSGKHHLIMMTKGNITEQTGKIERSGLKHYFAAIEIVAEKDVPTYRGIMEKYELARESSWMVGNSPKSDINPAIGAGIHAVFVPHDNTWIMEHEEVCSETGDCRLLQLERFSDLRLHF
ncbi:MAG TPA: HAD family hydrolase [Terriglobales bacterium]|nr:HAD family hydrolase [Terriglobales bacterium]